MRKSKTILGLDLGTSSVGWAMLKLDVDGNSIISGEILGTNSRIFSASVEGQGKAQKPKNAARREARQQRRQHRRKRIRKNLLRSLLVEHGLLPEIIPMTSSSVFNRLDQESNPYLLRSKALDEKLGLSEIGRIIFHIAKRRGFRSSRIHGKPNEDGPVLKEIGEIKSAMASSRTIGEFLSTLEKKRGSASRERRGYLARDDFESEFEQIWAKQMEFYPRILNVELKNKIWETVFNQRETRWDRALIGKCSYDPKKKRCYLAHQSAQRFRYWQDINNIRLQNKATFERIKLSTEQKNRLAEILESVEKISVDTIPKRLKILGDFQVNLSGSKKTLYGNRTAAAFRSAFAKGVWNGFSEEVKDKIINAFYRIGDDDQILRKHLKEKWGFENGQIERLLKINLEQNYSRHSLNAINKMLPFLNQGYLYNEAFRLAKYQDAFRSRWNQIQDIDREQIFDDLISFRGTESEIIHLRIRWGFDEKLVTAIERTYSSLRSKFDLPNLEKLEPLAENLRNPIAQKTLTQVRKVVNEIIRQYGKPDEIRVELGRDLKATKEQKDEYQRQQFRNERLNTEAEDQLGKYNSGSRVTGKQKLKYRLWKEAGEHCPYSGEYISPELLLADGAVEIDHIIPYERCWDDSYMNKTICLGYINREKGRRTPLEHFGSDNEVYYRILERTKSFPEPKQKRFQMATEEVEQIDWANRQLSDTRYISLKAREYLLRLYDNAQAVTVVTGQSTELLRRNWGLNRILNPSKNEDKNRRDHRHHAIDAIVVALTNRKLFDQISTLAGRNRVEMQSTFHNFPKPWTHFYEDVKEAIGLIDAVDQNDPAKTIVVSHSATHRIRGGLFKETAYQKIRDGLYRTRKALENLKKPNISGDDIIDPTIRELVRERFAEHNDIAKAFGPGSPPLYLKNGKKNKPTVIRKVRIQLNKSDETMIAVKSGTGENFKYYPLGGNHHVEIFENVLKGTRRAKVISRFEALRNLGKAIKNGHTPSPISGECSENEVLKFSLCQNDLVEIRGDDNILRVYRVQKMSEASGFDMTLRLPHDGYTKDGEGEFVRMSGFKKLSQIIRKLQVDPLGHLSQAND